MTARPWLALTATALVLAACGNQPPGKSVGAAPIGADASTGRPTLARSAAGPAGINRDYNTGTNPSIPGGGAEGGRGVR